MAWRKWLIRCLVFGVAGSCACALALYHHWTDPALVRRQVIDKLEQLFPGAAVSLESARLRILGGIVLTELRLVRRDDPDRLEILHVPSAVIYHDKEHLLDGKIAFRKVELQRPRLRVQRDRDGRWNVAGLATTEAGREPIPTLVIAQGTLILDDRLAQAGTPPVEVAGVNLVVINDPLPTVSFDGSGTSEILGALQWRGTWDRDSGALALSGQADGIPLNPLLVQRLAACCPNPVLRPFPLEGLADLKGDFSYHPDAAQPLTYDVRCAVRQGKVNHPQLPLPLENVAASVHCANGRVTVERFTASSGPRTRIDVARATALLARPEEEFDAVVSVKHLPLEKPLFDRLPKPIRDLADLFQPEGPVTVTIHAARQQGQWLRHRCTMNPEDLRVCFRYFPYPAERITGIVEYDYLVNLTRVNVQGYAGGSPATLQGYWKGGMDNTNARFDITATGLRLDETLLKALPDTPPNNVQAVARSFNPSGRCNAQARIQFTPGVKGFQGTYHAQLYGATVTWTEFPYRLENVTGCLDIYPDHWEGRDFRGSHGGGEVAVKGRTYPPAVGRKDGDTRLVIDVVGKNIALDGDLKAALKSRPALVTVWDTFSPTGQLNFTGRIDRVPGQPEHDLDLTLDVRGCAIEPTFFPYVLHDLTGTFRYHKDRVDLTRVTARHNATRLSLEKGTVDLYPGGGFYADLEDLRGNPVVPDAAFLAALPEGLRTACKGLKLADPFAVRTRLVVAQTTDTGAQPDIFWDGQAWLRAAKLQVGLDVADVTGTLACVGRHNGRQLQGLSGNLLLDRATVLGQPFHNVQARLLVKEPSPEVLGVALYAPTFGGDVSGQARIDFHADLRYELNLTASQIRLEEFGRHNFGPKSELTGLAAGRLFLTGQGSGLDSLDGSGTIDVPYTTATRLYNLPLLLDLIKFLGLRWPDRTAFEEAHAAFTIRGNRVNIGRLDLLGNVISLYGRGDVNLDGTGVQLDFYPSWARMEQVLPPVVRSIPPAISKNLLKIEVRGKVTGKADDVKFYKKPVPVLLDPLLQMRDLVTGKMGGKE
ncbi:MAG: hypothetical protein IT429_05405 [Gemmataceae bacterium]|nr:hypothetical protein [Gemmataceae bacterium]